LPVYFLPNSEEKVEVSFGGGGGSSFLDCFGA
jgi:hypothetical protein